MGIPFEKKTERVTIWLPESLLLDLTRLAHDDDRKLSDFITHALSTYAYGHRRCECVKRGDANSGEAQQ